MRTVSLAGTSSRRRPLLFPGTRSPSAGRSFLVLVASVVLVRTPISRSLIRGAFWDTPRHNPFQGLGREPILPGHSGGRPRTLDHCLNHPLLRLHRILLRHDHHPSPILPVRTPTLVPIGVTVRNQPGSSYTHHRFLARPASEACHEFVAWARGSTTAVGSALGWGSDPPIDFGHHHKN